MNPTISVSRHDWSLHRKGPVDQARHNAKIKEAIKDNLPEIVAEESIITSDGRQGGQGPDPLARAAPLPLRPPQEQARRAGPGRLPGRRRHRPGRAGAGPGAGQAGRRRPRASTTTRPRSTLDELAALVFEDLGLPNLQQKQQQELEAETIRFTEIRKHRASCPTSTSGARSWRTSSATPCTGERPLRRTSRNDDLRFKTWDRRVRARDQRRRHRHDGRLRLDGRVREVHHPQLLLLDGALPAHQVRQRRDRLHHPPHRGQGGRRGGVLQPRRERRHARSRRPTSWRSTSSRSATTASGWNIYPFHFSDGDNWGDADNERCVELVNAAASSAPTSSATARSRRAPTASATTLMTRLRRRSRTSASSPS